VAARFRRKFASWCLLSWTLSSVLRILLPPLLPLDLWVQMLMDVGFLIVVFTHMAAFPWIYHLWVVLWLCCYITYLIRCLYIGVLLSFRKLVLFTLRYLCLLLMFVEEQRLCQNVWRGFAMLRIHLWSSIQLNSLYMVCLAAEESLHLWWNLWILESLPGRVLGMGI
jgi:hypothetical protein